MRAVTIRDKNLSVEEHPDPVPGHGEVLVRVTAAGLNGADMMQRRGFYPAPPGAPQDIPGLELAGEVSECGPGATDSHRPIGSWGSSRAVVRPSSRPCTSGS